MIEFRLTCLKQIWIGLGISLVSFSPNMYLAQAADARLDSIEVLLETLLVNQVNLLQRLGSSDGLSEDSDPTILERVGKLENDSARLQLEIVNLREKLEAERNRSGALHEARKKDIEQLVDYHYSGITLACEDLLIGRTLSAMRDLVNGLQDLVQLEQGSFDERTRNKLSELSQALGVFERVKKDLSEAKVYKNGASADLLEELKKVTPSLRTAAKVASALLIKAPQYLDHTCEILDEEKPESLQMLFFEEIYALQFIDRDLVLGTVERGDDFVLNEERLKAFTWLNQEVGRVVAGQNTKDKFCQK